MFKNKLYGLGASLIISTALTGFAVAQDTTQKTTTTTVTKKEVVQNPDGTYTVIEYPVGKEVTVELTPYNLQGAKGWAHVMRTDDGTNVAVDLSGLPADAKSYYVYAVDPTGAATLLGPVSIESGTSKATFKTPMSRFMLVLSPTEGLSTVANDTAVVFRSSVPTGYAVVPAGITSSTTNTKQVAVTDRVASTYEVPTITGLPMNKTTEMRINFSGELSALKAKAYIRPRTEGSTEIKMRFDEMKNVAANKRLVLWLVTPDKTYTKLGQVVNTGQRDEAEIRSETALNNFGLFVTMEDTEADQPSSMIYAPVIR